jgi:DNA-binding NtrC family response regulator
MELPWTNVKSAWVAEALERVGGNQTKAAQILHVSRDKIRYKMNKHGLRQK